MSFVNVAPEVVASSAGDLDGIRSALSAANAAAAPSTTGVAPPAMDQVSAAIAAVLGTHALEYQTVSAQVADFHAQFVGALNSSVSQYLSTEAANAEQSLLNAVNSPAQALLGTRTDGDRDRGRGRRHRRSGGRRRWRSGRRHGGNRSRSSFPVLNTAIRWARSSWR